MKLIELEEVDSTNDYLKKEYQNLPMQTCVTAKYQTKGRGRNGHVWESHANENLIMSFYLKIFIKIRRCLENDTISKRVVWLVYLIVIVIKQRLNGRMIFMLMEKRFCGI